MPSLPAERCAYYQKHLNELLQNAASHIRSYYSSLDQQASQLSEQVTRLWELSQRYRLVANSCNSLAAAALLSACQQLYEPIHQTILQGSEGLNELSLCIQQFQQLGLALATEQEQVNSECSPLNEWISWLEQTLTVLQTHNKYLELHSRLLLPQLLQEQTVQQFKKDLCLPEQYKALICLGLARAERKPQLLWYQEEKIGVC